MSWLQGMSLDPRNPESFLCVLTLTWPGIFCARRIRERYLIRKSVKIRGAEGKWISGDTLGCPDLGSGRPELGKSEKSGRVFPPSWDFLQEKAETSCIAMFKSSHVKNGKF